MNEIKVRDKIAIYYAGILFSEDKKCGDLHYRSTNYTAAKRIETVLSIREI